MITYLMLLILGFVVLIKSADFLVDGASALAQKLSLPEIAIGLTVVAFGTSAPELVVNIIASVKHHSEICFGNILGSNILNTLIILGVAALIKPLTVKKTTIKYEIPLLLGGTFLTFLLVNNFFIGGHGLSRLDAVILFALFIVFLYYVFFVLKGITEFIPEVHKHTLWVAILLVVGGIVGLFIGGKLVVNYAVKLAKIFNVSEKLIGLTVVAFGTSLPELITSIVAITKNKPDMSVGNVIGSNIFNLLMVLGISGMINPISYDLTLNKDFIFLLVASIFLFLFLFKDKKARINRLEGVLFILGYLVYLILIIIRK